MRNLDALLKALVSTLASADRPLADEIRAIGGSKWLTTPNVSRSLKTRAAGTGLASLRPSVRNIVLRTGRPVLAIVGNTPAAPVQRQRQCGVASPAAGLRRPPPARRHGCRPHRRDRPAGCLPYVGTGWLVEKNTIVTNRHVAREFGRRKRGGFTFKKGSGARPMTASIDFLEEAGRVEELEFPIIEILHIEDESGPDFALLRVEDRSGAGALASPIALATAPVQTEQQVAVIGYPARDSRVPDVKLMHPIFGDVYDKKRLAPGQITEVQRDVLLHDCSTLGGNSGSVLLDLATGEAAGLHFAGRFLETNYAVPAAIVHERVERILSQGRCGLPACPIQRPAPRCDAADPRRGRARGCSRRAPADYANAWATTRRSSDPRCLSLSCGMPPTC